MAKNVIVVTGGCGYLGSHTIVELMMNGFDVVSIDNHSRSSPLVPEKIYKITGSKFYNFGIDLCSKLEVVNFFQSVHGIAGIIHFAAFKSVPESMSHPEIYYNNNIMSLVNVLEAGSAAGINNAVFSSSCSVYGDINQLPVSEDTALSPSKSPYATTKIMGELIMRDMAVARNLNVMCLRYFNPVGAHPSGLIGEMPLSVPDNLVPVITQTAIGKREQMTVFGGSLSTRDGSCIRDYVHVMDIARAHVLAMKYLQSRSNVLETLNLGTGVGVSVLEAINAFEEVSGKQLKYSIGDPRPGDVVEIYSNASKAKRILGWQAEYSIRDMMQSAWMWELELSKQNHIPTIHD